MSPVFVPHAVTKLILAPFDERSVSAACPRVCGCARSAKSAQVEKTRRIAASAQRRAASPSYPSLIESQNRSRLALLSARAKSHIRRCKPVWLAGATAAPCKNKNRGACFLYGILKLHFVRVLWDASHLSRFGLAFGILRPASPASRF